MVGSLCCSLFGSMFVVYETSMLCNRVQMLAQRIESTITIYSNWGAASALGVVLLLLALVMIWLMNRVFGLDKLFMR